MDFNGASDLADRLMPTNPESMNKLVASLPKEAQGVVQAMPTADAAADSGDPTSAVRIKYKSDIEKGWMGVERDKIGPEGKESQ